MPNELTSPSIALSVCLSVSVSPGDLCVPNELYLRALLCLSVCLSVSVSPGDLCVPKELTSPSISLKGEDSDDVTDEGEDKVTSFEPEPEVIFTSFEPEVIFKSVKSDAVYYDAVFKKLGCKLLFSPES